MATFPVFNGRITSGYGNRILDGKKQFHGGIDIVQDSSKPIVIAAYPGTVIACGWSDTFGNRVWVEYNKNIFVVYAHLDSINPELKIGTKVFEKDFIGIMGNTGLSQGKHLHFELRTQPDMTGKSINPIEITNLIKY